MIYYDEIAEGYEELHREEQEKKIFYYSPFFKLKRVHGDKTGQRDQDYATK